MDDNGLLYLRARYYHPALGVFTGLDPVENLNRYQYVGGNTINRIDPSGMIDEVPPLCNSHQPDDISDCIHEHCEKYNLPSLRSVHFRRLNGDLYETCRQHYECHPNDCRQVVEPRFFLDCQKNEMIGAGDRSRREFIVLMHRGRASIIITPELLEGSEATGTCQIGVMTLGADRDSVIVGGNTAGAGCAISRGNQGDGVYLTFDGV